MARRHLKDIEKAKHRKIVTAFSDNVKEIRISKGFTQTDVSNKCNLSQKHIADIELGKSANPTIETICEAAEGLNVKDPLDLLRRPK